MFVKRGALLIALNVLGGAAWAADLPLKAPAIPAYDWTGFYLGGNLGAANGTSSFSDTIRPAPSTFSSSNPASFIGGGQLGINYEFRSGLVVGAEAMFDWLSNAPTTFTASNLKAGAASGTINNRWITMATGKVGFALDRLLVYGKAGGAWVGGTSNSFSAGGTPVAVSIGSGSVGWTAAPASNGLLQAIGRHAPNMISSACRIRTLRCRAVRPSVLPATRSISTIAPSR